MHKEQPHSTYRRLSLALAAAALAVTVGCAGGPPSQSSNECSCDPGQVCVAGVCADVCLADGDCAKADSCVDGTCKRVNNECTEDGACTSPAACEASAGAYCLGGECFYQPFDCTQQAPFDYCAARTGQCNPGIVGCYGASCCEYDLLWTDTTAPRVPCPLTGEDVGTDGIQDDGETWSGLCDEAGACASCTLDTECDDGNPCSVDTCSAAGKCVHDTLSMEGITCTINHPADGRCIVESSTSIRCLLDDGEPSTDASLCQSGASADGYCCNTACDGNCNRCDVSTALGVCTLVDTLCTGDCDVCDGVSGSCVADQSACPASGATLCTVCTGADTAFSCTYDAGLDADCGSASLQCAAAGSCLTRTAGACGADAECSSGACGVGGCCLEPGNCSLDIQAGERHACVLHNDGTIWCWGLNGNGQLGDTTQTTASNPVKVYGLNNATAVATGWYHTCAIDANQDIWCWGSNSSGQLGINSTQQQLSPVQVQGGHKAIAIAAGATFTCAIDIDGAVWCWGLNTLYQLGDGTTTQHLLPVQTLTDATLSTPLTGAVAIAAGLGHACVLLGADSSVWCWGLNANGQGGINSTSTYVTVATQVSALAAPAGSVALGANHSCALMKNGTAQCWGYNMYGQLGDNSTTDRLAPVQVSGLSSAATLAAGQTHTCATLLDGTAKCWGYNASGQLHDGTLVSPRKVPVSVVNLAGAAAIAVYKTSSTTYVRTCAVVAGGDIACWTGTGTRWQAPLDPPIQDAHSGGTAACAIDNDSHPWCWGANDTGQLGINSTVASAPPTRVAQLDKVLKIAQSGYHACAVDDAHNAWCWGTNTSGQLGYVDPPDPAVTSLGAPVAVANLSGVLDVDVSSGFSCALLDGGTVWCWGDNSSGQLGNGTQTRSGVPVQVSGVSGAVAIAMGSNHACALIGPSGPAGSEGTVWCWGQNAYGQLGNDATLPQPTPVQAVGLTNATAIDCGNYHTCAVSGGLVACWGNDSFGALGNGASLGESHVPMLVGGLDSVTQVALGGFSTCALKTDGSLRCWGRMVTDFFGSTYTNETPITTEVTRRAASLVNGELGCLVFEGGALHCAGSWDDFWHPLVW